MFSRRLLSFVFGLFLLASFSKVTLAAQAPSLLAPNVLVLDLETGTTLYEQAADEATSVASLSKLMVALFVFEQLDLEDIVTISSNAANTEGATAYLEAGERFYVEDLLYALLVPSGNDAAMAFAEHIGGTEWTFLDMMDARALELGMNNTIYGSAPGFDTVQGYSTAEDVAIVAQALLEYELFREIIQTETTTLVSLDGISRDIINTNQILGDTVSGLTVIGMKTGTTPEAGQCLVVLAKDAEGDEVLIVLLGSTDRYADATALLTWVGENHEIGDTAEPEPTPDTSDALEGWPFPDIESYGQAFFETMLALNEAGIVLGDDDTGLLRGEDSLNRAEMVTFLLRAAGYDEADIETCAELHGTLIESDFSDVDLDAWYSDTVHCAANLGWVSGDDLPEDAEEGTLPTFRPGDPVNLSEAMKLVVESQLGYPGDLFAGAEWYDVYLNFLMEGAHLEESMDREDNYTFAYTGYDLGDVSSFISRAGAFELLYRLLNSEISGGVAYYDPYLSVEDYMAQGASVEVSEEGLLYVSDPDLDFELSGVPMGGFELSELKIFIENVSGVESDYYTRWSLIYPVDSGPTVTQDTDQIFHVLIYDEDYIEADLELDYDGDLVTGNRASFQLSCDALDDGTHEDLVDLKDQICPDGEISETIEVEED